MRLPIIPKEEYTFDVSEGQFVERLFHEKLLRDGKTVFVNSIMVNKFRRPIIVYSTAANLDNLRESYSFIDCRVACILFQLRMYVQSYHVSEMILSLIGY